MQLYPTKLDGSNLVLVKWQTVQRRQESKSGALPEQGNLHVDISRERTSSDPVRLIPMFHVGADSAVVVLISYESKKERRAEPD
ncbi:hypothetical protein [Chitinophaga sp. S165]|uniref:hypothetical protein n=1 Tax=Chitinophaga sp. S165 TaxID=2135462 RepID=UPI000D71AC26|nr:hypothetical protein [Chitinophaga sp. S165]PWV44533.1 hypothetical protein C7475_12017 [Chitinophaga sp. S165]